MLKKRGLIALMALTLPINLWAVEEVAIESLEQKVQRLETEMAAVKAAIKMQALAPAQAAAPVSATTNFIMDTSSALTWSGFASTSVARSDSETEYLERFSDRENYTDTRLGLNVSAHLTESFTIAGQILMAGREDGYNAHADWIFATWSPVDWADLMIGRIKYPNLLFSEVYDVGAVMPWIRPPQELYSFTPLSSNYTYEVMSGISPRFNYFLGDYELTLQPYAGNADMEFGKISNMTGLSASIGDDEMMLMLGFNRGDLDFGGGGHGAEGGSELLEVMNSHLDGRRREVLSASLSIDKNNFLVLAEWAESEIKEKHHAGFADYDAISWYTMVGYRFGDWTPHLTFASLDQDSGTGQDSTTLGVRYDASPSVAVKAEWSRIDPESRDDEIKTSDRMGFDPSTEDDEELAHPAGLFEHLPNNGKVNLFTIGLDFTF